MSTPADETTDRSRTVTRLLQAVDAAGGRVEARRLATQAWRLVTDDRVAAMWFTASAEVRIARTCLRLGMHEEAEAVLLPCYETFSAQIGADHGETRTIRRLLFDLYTASGRPEQASLYADPPT